MRKSKKIVFLFIILLSLSCSDNFDLKVDNKNDLSVQNLETEAGILSAAPGAFSPDIFWRYTWSVMGNHEIMGDNTFMFGCCSWRWIQQNTWIELDEGTIIYSGRTQEEELIKRNTLEEGWYNAFAPEWIIMYYINGQANLILENINKVEFNGNSEIRKNTLLAWCYWLKAFAYSRIGSIYKEGIINDQYGITNNNYLSGSEIINEANNLFDDLIAILENINSNDDYYHVLEKCVPPYYQENGIPSPDEWIRSANSYKARNLLVNNKVTDMSNSDWNTILNLAESGVQLGDHIFYYTDDPYIVDRSSIGAALYFNFMFVSERLVQDFKPGDDRFTRNFVQVAPWINIRNRGIHFGTEWDLINNKDYSTGEYGGIKYAIGVSYEENELMLAEAKIHLGSIDNGLSHIDQVRKFQNASLTNVSNTGLNFEEAKEELRIERRIGLFTRGLAFYDARRWGVLDDVSVGGGRTGCWVWAADGTKNLNATFNYNFMSYFDVPASETEFNITD